MFNFGQNQSNAFANNNQNNQNNQNNNWGNTNNQNNLGLSNNFMNNNINTGNNTGFSGLNNGVSNQTGFNMSNNNVQNNQNGIGTSFVGNNTNQNGYINNQNNNLNNQNPMMNQNNNQNNNIINNYDLHFSDIKDTVQDIQFFNNNSFIYCSWDMSVGILELKNYQLNLINKKIFNAIPLKITINNNKSLIFIIFDNNTAKLLDYNLNELNNIHTGDLVLYSFLHNDNFGLVKLNGEICIINETGQVGYSKKFNNKISIAYFSNTYLGLVFLDNSYLIINIEYLIHNFNQNSKNSYNKISNSNKISSFKFNMNNNTVHIGFIDGRINVNKLLSSNSTLIDQGGSNNLRFIAHYENKDTYTVNDSCLLSNNDTILITSCSMGRIIVWDKIKKSKFKEINLKTLINGFELSPHNDFIVIKGGYDWCLGFSGIYQKDLLLQNKTIDNSIGIIYLNKLIN